MNKSSRFLSQQTALIGFGFLLVLLIAGTAQKIGFRSVEDNHQRLEHLVNQNNAKFVLMTTMRDVIRKRILNLYDIVLVTGDAFELDEKMMEYNKAATEFVVARDELLKLDLSAVQRRQIEKQKATLRQARAIVNSVLEQAWDGNTEGAVENVRKARAANEGVLRELKLMRDTQQNLAREGLIESTLAYDRAKEQIRFLNISALLLSLLVIGFVIKRITTLDQALKHALDALEDANTNLENRVEEKTRALMLSQEENIRLGAELNVTRQLQKFLLPSSKELRHVDYLDIAAYMEPAAEVGGDYYDILLRENGLRIGIGDVTGHGLESCVIMLMTQTAVRALLTNIDHDVKKTMLAVNNTIYENIKRMGCEKNLTLALLDYQQIKAHGNGVLGLLHISGQHEVIIVVRALDNKLEIIDTDKLGFPIGLIKDVSPYVNDISINLYKGDVVVLFTDGITEAANEENQLFGLDNLCDAVHKHAQNSAEAIKNAIIRTVTKHIGTQEVYDDITLVVLKQ